MYSNITGQEHYYDLLMIVCDCFASRYAEIIFMMWLVWVIGIPSATVCD